MNKWIGVGRLTARPELKYTSTNVPKVNFTVAIPRTYGEKITDFINCVVWNKTAENLCKYQDKGNLISIEGTIRIDKYQDKDGNNKLITYVLVENIQYLESKKESTEQVNNQVQEEQEEHDPFSDFGNSVSIDDEFLD